MRSVVLPAPLGPINAVVVPGWKLKLRPCARPRYEVSGGFGKRLGTQMKYPQQCSLLSLREEDALVAGS
eukprot:12238480-Prorocentrum_lima.AAC.1